MGLFSSGSKKQKVSQITTTIPWEGQDPHLRKIMGEAERVYNEQPPQFFPGRTYVSRDPLENLAQLRTLKFSGGGLQNQANALRKAQMEMFNAPNVATNPYLAGQADVIQRRLNRNLTQNLLPSIRSGAIASGTFGGSRQGIAEGQAIGRTQEALGDSLSQLYGDAYGKGLEQQARGVGFAPQSMQTTMMPYKVQGNVGAYNRGERELMLQDRMARHEFEQNAPHLRLQNYASLVHGTPWGSSTSGQQSGGGDSGFSMSGALGGASLGAKALPLLFGGNPIIGAIAGGLLGGLF